MSSKVKLAIIIILYLSLSPLLSIITLILIIKARDTDPNRFSQEISDFIYAYDDIRKCVFDTKNIICMGSYVSEYEGKTCYFSKFISMYVKNFQGSFESSCRYMECRKVESDIYYQYAIKKKYSKIAKITIILSVLKYIREKYPNDLVTVDRKSPILISAIEVLKNNE